MGKKKGRPNLSGIKWDDKEQKSQFMHRFNKKTYAELKSDPVAYAKMLKDKHDYFVKKYAELKEDKEAYRQHRDRINAKNRKKRAIKAKEKEIERKKEYATKYPDVAKLQFPMLQYTKLRFEAISVLGGKCVWCGNDNLCVLEVDHVLTDGKSMTQKHGGRYNELVCLRNNPSEFIGIHQVLCANCHRMKTSYSIHVYHKKAVGIAISKKDVHDYFGIES